MPRHPGGRSATLEEVIHRLRPGCYVLAWPVADRWEGPRRRGGLVVGVDLMALVAGGGRTYTSRYAARRAAGSWRLPLAPTPLYTCHGFTRGRCGHIHRSLEAARRCCARDARRCTRPWQVPDREVIPLT